MPLYPSAPGIAVKGISIASLDYSNVAEGYVCAYYTGDPAKKCKIAISCGGKSQNFTVVAGGAVMVFPLCYGDGYYQIQLVQQVVDTQYKVIIKQMMDVKLRTPFVPFLYPSVYADYKPASKCVAKAAELCKGKATAVDKFKAIEAWIVKNIKYDHALATRVQTETWWLPDPDEVLSEGKSICFGYASLLAAMCRSQDIPAKVAVGTATALIGKHAWNEVFIDNLWRRVDATNATVYYEAFGDKYEDKYAIWTKNVTYQMEYCG